MSYGQINVNPGKFPVPTTGERFSFDNSHFANSISRAVGDTNLFWVNFPYSLSRMNTPPTYSLGAYTMAPDTLLWVRYQKEEAGKYVFTYTNPFICAAGTTFQLFSAVLSSLNNLRATTPYTVDSADIVYIYRRYTADNIVDTLIVQLYKPTHMVFGYYTMQSTGDRRDFGIPKYKRSTNMGSPADYTVKIPLTIADTSRDSSGVGFFRDAFVKLPTWALTTGGQFALTYSFKPGRSYSLNDTIPLAKWDSVQGVYKPINLFRCGVFGDAGQNSLSPETNNGLWITNWCRYKDWNTTVPSFANTFLPGNAWDVPLYPIVLFKVKYIETVGINHLENDVKIQLYPSPATTSQDMNLDMTLDGKKNISIDVYDLLGHKVSSVTNGNYNSGKHTFSIGTSDLGAGMYICNIVADGAVKTIKFEVR